MRWIVANLHWIMILSGALITRIGAMPIYGALSKAVFIVLVFSQAERYLGA
jgi:hypothetical protein